MGLACRRGFDVQFDQNVAQQLVGRKIGVRKKRQFEILTDLSPEVKDQRRFARSDLAGEQDDADVALDTVFQIFESVIVVGAQIQEVGVGVDLKRFFFKPVIIFVH